MRHPDCPRNTPNACRIQRLGGMSTLVGWTPEYDREGRLLNEDPNTHTDAYRCSLCGMEWTTKRRYGDTTVKVTRPAHQPEEGKIVPPPTTIWEDEDDK